MLLFNCEIIFQLTWSANCVIANSVRAGTFTIINTRLYVPAVTLLTQDNTKILQQLNSGFKRTIKWNKSVTKDLIQTQKRNLIYLVHLSFQGVEIICMSSFKNEKGRREHAEYYLPKAEIKD